jgi:hypothetical protein
VEAAPGEARQLHRDAQCGYVRVPLDRTKPDGKTIKVYFERYPRRNSELPRTSTVVSIEGGPGYPSRPAARRASICGVRSRASGISCSSTCEEPAGAHRSAARHSRASSAATWPAPAAVPPRSGRSETCIRPRKPCRTWRPCCARFTPARSASTATPTGRTPPRPTRSASRSDSLARARRGLPLAGNRPVWADLAEAIRRGPELSCSRSAGCPTKSPVKLVERFADRVREAPILGLAPDGDGTRTKVRLNEDALVQLVSGPGRYLLRR